MTTQQLLFILTFVFGPLRLIISTIIFSGTIGNIAQAVLPKWTRKRPKWNDKLIDIANIIMITIFIIGNCCMYLAEVFTYFSLCYQVWFWFIHIANIV